jgi:hypothetical protein
MILGPRVHRLILSSSLFDPADPYGPAVQKGFKYGSEYLVHVDFVFAHRPRFAVYRLKAGAVVERVGEQYQGVHFLRRIDVARSFNENVLGGASFEIVVRAKCHHERTVVRSARWSAGGPLESVALR